jgi:hypothetical protein
MGSSLLTMSLYVMTRNTTLVLIILIAIQAVVKVAVVAAVLLLVLAQVQALGRTTTKPKKLQ